MQDIKIIVVESNPDFRLNLKKVITEQLKAKVIAEASNGYEFEQLPNIDKCDIVLIDTKLPDANGYTLANNALWKNSKLNFIAIPFRDYRISLDSLLMAGFKGCVYKNNIYDELPKALKAVLSRQMYFPKDIPVTQASSIN
jgi:DNA-binding NarL/FixJ family response regulator